VYRGSVIVCYIQVNVFGFMVSSYVCRDSFGGIVVSMLASGTRVRGFKLGRNRWIFRTSEKSSACLPSEGKRKNLSQLCGM